MAKWIEYAGSDDQINEINSAEKYITRLDKNRRTQYLICETHPYADIIKIWADTGLEVWVRYKWRDSTGPRSETYVTDEPNWNMPDAEYRLTPFEEEELNDGE